MRVSALLYCLFGRYSGLLAQRSVRRCTEILEERAVEYIPLALEPRLAQLRRQCFKLAYVIGVGIHQRLVICYLALNKSVIAGVFPALVNAIYRQPLYPAMPHTAGVTGNINAVRKVICAAHAGRKLAKTFLRLMCALINKQNIRFSALKALRILIRIAVPEQNAAAVRESDNLLLIVVLRKPLRLFRRVAVQIPCKRYNVVLLQFRVRFADYHARYAGVFEAVQHSGNTHNKAFTAASRTAEENILCSSLQELTLRGA